MLLSLYSLHPCRGPKALCCYASFFPFAIRRYSRLLDPRRIFWVFTPLRLHSSVMVGNCSSGKTCNVSKATIAPLADIEIDLPCVAGASDLPPVGSNPVPDAEHDTSSDSEVEDERAASPIPLPPPAQEPPDAIADDVSVTLEPLPQDASSSSGAADEWSDVHGQADEYLFLLNGMSHIAHKAQPCSTSHPAFQVMVPHLKLSLRAGCSVRGVESLQFSEFVPEGFRMCLKRGCLLD